MFVIARSVGDEAISGREHLILIEFRLPIAEKIVVGVDAFVAGFFWIDLNDGKVFLVSQDGTLSVVEAKGDWEILSVNPLEDEVFATPAIADGRIYVRTKSQLYAFGAALIP